MCAFQTAAFPCNPTSMSARRVRASRRRASITSPRPPLSPASAESAAPTLLAPTNCATLSACTRPRTHYHSHTLHQSVIIIISITPSSNQGDRNQGSPPLSRTFSLHQAARSRSTTSHPTAERANHGEQDQDVTCSCGSAIPASDRSWHLLLMVSVTGVELCVET